MIEAREIKLLQINDLAKCGEVFYKQCSTTKEEELIYMCSICFNEFSAEDGKLLFQQHVFEHFKSIVSNPSKDEIIEDSSIDDINNDAEYLEIIEMEPSFDDIIEHVGDDYQIEIDMDIDNTVEEFIIEKDKSSKQNPPITDDDIDDIENSTDMVNKVADDIQYNTNLNSDYKIDDEKIIKNRCHFCSHLMNIDSLEEHINRVHFKNGESQQCFNCSETFTEWTAWQNHRTNVHDNKEIAHDHQYDNLENLKLSNETATKNEQNLIVKPTVAKKQCMFCDLSLTPNSYWSHISRRHFSRGSTQKCFNCNELLDSWASWRKHQYFAHNIGNDYQPKSILLQKKQCWFCTMKLSRNSLVEHMKRRHFKNGAKQTCIFCEEKFDSWPTIKEHCKKTHVYDYDDENTPVTMLPIFKNERTDVDPSSAAKFPNCPNCKKIFGSTLAMDKHIKFDRCRPLLSEMALIKLPVKRYKCKNCPRIFAERSKFSHHMQWHKSIKPKILKQDHHACAGDVIFLCRFCQKSFSSKLHLLAHMKIGCQLEKLRFTCTFCHHKSYFSETIKKHLKRAHFNRKIKLDQPKKCTHQHDNEDVNDILLEDLAGCMDHINKHHMELVTELVSKSMNDTCTQCNTGFKCYGQEDEHFEIVHSIKNPFKCDKCSANFEQQSLLVDHEELHNHTNLPTCEHCNQIFQCQLDLDLHKSGSIEMTENLNPTDEFKSYTTYKCKQCRRHYNSQKQLDIHARCHSAPFKCTVCNRGFFELTIFDNHMKAHEYGKINGKYHCNECEYETMRMDKFQLHMTKHSDNETIFACDICNKKFCAAGYLTVHRRLHTNEKVALCWICGKSFYLNSKYKIHMRKHAGTELRFACNLCEKRFISPCDLNAHICMQHTGERPFQCEYCNKGFTANKYKKRHRCSFKNELNLFLHHDT